MHSKIFFIYYIIGGFDMQEECRKFSIKFNYLKKGSSVLVSFWSSTIIYNRKDDGVK